MKETISDLREQIDQIDEELLRLFQERMEVCGKIGQIKRHLDLAVRNEVREAEVLAKMEHMADVEYTPYVTEFFEKLMELSRDYQQGLVGNDPHHLAERYAER